MDDSLKYMNVCCVRRQFNHLGGRGRVVGSIVQMTGTDHSSPHFL